MGYATHPATTLSESPSLSSNGRPTQLNRSLIQSTQPRSNRLSATTPKPVPDPSPNPRRCSRRRRRTRWKRRTKRSTSLASMRCAPMACAASFRRRETHTTDADSAVVTASTSSPFCDLWLDIGFLQQTKSVLQTIHDFMAGMVQLGFKGSFTTRHVCGRVCELKLLMPDPVNGFALALR